MMTTQTLNKYCMQTNCNDPAFLIRWLHGQLSQEELASMNNREDYEEMMEQMGRKGLAPLPEDEIETPNGNTGESEDSDDDQSPILKFVAVTAIVGSAGWLVLKSLTNIL